MGSISRGGGRGRAIWIKSTKRLRFSTSVKEWLVVFHYQHLTCADLLLARTQLLSPRKVAGSSTGPGTAQQSRWPHSRSFSALVAIPTKDGHLLELDPLQMSPGVLDAFEGITDSAKKQARAEIGRLVQAAVDKWKIR